MVPYSEVLSQSIFVQHITDGEVEAMNERIWFSSVKVTSTPNSLVTLTMKLSLSPLGVDWLGFSLLTRRQEMFLLATVKLYKNNSLLWHVQRGGVNIFFWFLNEHLIDNHLRKNWYKCRYKKCSVHYIIIHDRYTTIHAHMPPCI